MAAKPYSFVAKLQRICRLDKRGRAWPVYRYVSTHACRTNSFCFRSEGFPYASFQRRTCRLLDGSDLSALQALPLFLCSSPSAWSPSFILSTAMTSGQSLSCSIFGSVSLCGTCNAGGVSLPFRGECLIQSTIPQAWEYRRHSVFDTPLSALYFSYSFSSWPGFPPYLSIALSLLLHLETYGLTGVAGGAPAHNYSDRFHHLQACACAARRQAFSRAGNRQALLS